MIRNCRVCDVPLVVGENVTQNQIDRSQYICRTCRKEHAALYNTLHPEKRVAQHAAYYTRRMEDAAYRASRREKAATYHATHKEHCKEWKHRTGRSQPINENRTCASFLGIHVAERVLSRVFKDVGRMPMNNPNYDFICNRGKKIDVKSACLNHSKRGHRWQFHIKKNIVADYFLCLAFDNRDDLNPLHLWLIPGNVVNQLDSLSISLSTTNKFKKYELDVCKVVKCCAVVR